MFCLANGLQGVFERSMCETKSFVWHLGCILFITNFKIKIHKEISSVFSGAMQFLTPPACHRLAKNNKINLFRNIVYIRLSNKVSYVRLGKYHWIIRKYIISSWRCIFKGKGREREREEGCEARRSRHLCYGQWWDFQASFNFKKKYINWYSLRMY